jgi:hypothetical protein
MIFPSEYPINVPAAMVAFFVWPATLDVPIAMHCTQAELKKLIR